MESSHKHTFLPFFQSFAVCARVYYVDVKSRRRYHYITRFDEIYNLKFSNFSVPNLHRGINDYYLHAWTKLTLALCQNLKIIITKIIIIMTDENKTTNDNCS